jgi:tetratricopeptide (TPR) repeat protein
MKINKITQIISVLLLQIFLFQPVSVYAAQDAPKTEKPEYTFYKGNTQYENGRYEEAITEYSRLLNLGLESGNVYFNLGNSYFKKGELGMAILNFERARRLIPGDSDLKANYRYALSSVYQVESADEMSLVKSAITLFDVFTIDRLTMALSLLYIIAILLIVIRIIHPNTRRFVLIGILMSALLFLPGAVALYQKASLLEKEAIIVSERTEAQFEPIDDATTHFTLYEGMKVTVTQSKIDWVKVRRPDGKTGWIRTDSAVVI